MDLVLHPRIGLILEMQRGIRRPRELQALVHPEALESGGFPAAFEQFELGFFFGADGGATTCGVPREATAHAHRATARWGTGQRVRQVLAVALQVRIFQTLTVLPTTVTSEEAPSIVLELRPIVSVAAFVVCKKA